MQVQLLKLLSVPVRAMRGLTDGDEVRAMRGLPPLPRKEAGPKRFLGGCSEQVATDGRWRWSFRQWRVIRIGCRLRVC